MDIEYQQFVDNHPHCDRQQLHMLIAAAREAGRLDAMRTIGLIRSQIIELASRLPVEGRMEFYSGFGLGK